MRRKRLFAGVITAVFGLSVVGIISASAVTTERNTSYTIEDIKNLQDFLLARDTPDLKGKDYDLNDDGRWDVFDLCLMKREYVQSQNTGKTLIVYFSMPESAGTDASSSASRVVIDGEMMGSTQYIANLIQENTGGDLFRIETVQTYPGNHEVLVEQAYAERDANARPELASHIMNLDEYDTIFVGYPMWCYDMPMAMYSFFEEYDFSGKTIIPFNTHGGSNFSSTFADIQEMQPNANLVTNGYRVSRNSVADAEESVIQWLDELGLRKEEESHTLVVYFSTPEITDATTTASRVTVNGKTYGTTEYMAAVIHENTDSDIFKIELAEPYGSDVPDRALNEQQNGILPELSSHIENLDQYDTIFVGYPTWWYDMPQVMYSFFDEYDFSGKTVIPFNSHGGSGFSGSVQEIAELEPNATVRTDGLTISRGVVANSENTIVNWLDDIGMKKL